MWWQINTLYFFPDRVIYDLIRTFRIGLVLPDDRGSLCWLNPTHLFTSWKKKKKPTIWFGQRFSHTLDWLLGVQKNYTNKELTSFNITFWLQLKHVFVPFINLVGYEPVVMRCGHLQHLSTSKLGQELGQVGPLFKLARWASFRQIYIFHLWKSNIACNFDFPNSPKYMAPSQISPWMIGASWLENDVQGWNRLTVILW